MAERAAHFDSLFSHNINGVFFMRLDEPIGWREATDRDALLDYAFGHLRFAAVNDAACQQLGAKREQLLGVTPSQRWVGDPKQWRAAMRALYDQGHVHHTLRAPRNDGSWFDVEGHYVCTYDAHGRITGHYGTQRDVSTERSTIAALAKSQERLELAIAGGAIGIWDFDLTTNSFDTDARWLERFGYSLDAMRWHDPAWWESITHADDVAEVRRQLTKHIAGETDHYSVERRLRAASGEWIWLFTTGRATARDGNGRALRIVGTCIDITERKQLQARLVASERLAALGTLAAGVGHEINNPLTYIGLNLTLVERELAMLANSVPAAAIQRIRGMIEQARYGTERVGAVVRNLQALSRTPEERVGRVDLNAILMRCLDIADHQIRHRARVVRELAAIPHVLSSEDRMLQLCLNLMVNAAQAIPEGNIDRHEIRIASSTSPEGDAIIVVSDTGVGIASAHVDRIFDPFFTTKPIGQGTGLGLAICRTIVSSMRGEIRVESRPGRTTFRVSLPAAAPSEAPRAPASVNTPHAPTGLRLLVIDDEPIVGELIERILDDYVVSTETSARAALERLRSGEGFDRILCDLMMPEVSGMEFYDQLRELAPELLSRVVFLTGGAFTERARSFLERVPNRRLHKPFDVDALRTAIG
ncbi:MAG: Sensor histidine kinase [Myxococcales bacterium]|nr:Sensor histidine kinase [Myxococcales bacterium]